MTAAPDSWLALIVSLPSTRATTRMRLWRAVKALGCAALRDGASRLPAWVEQAARLQALADAVMQDGGQAWPGPLLQAVRQAPRCDRFRGGRDSRGHWLDCRRGDRDRAALDHGLDHRGAGGCDGSCPVALQENPGAGHRGVGCLDRADSAPTGRARLISGQGQAPETAHLQRQGLRE